MCTRGTKLINQDRVATDLMIEAKDKEQAVFHLFRRYGLHPVFHGTPESFETRRCEKLTCRTR